MNMFHIKLAGRVIGIRCHHDFAVQACENYKDTSTETDFSVCVTEAEVDEELRHAEFPVSADYAEFICLYRKIAEQLPRYHCAVLHGAAISYKDSGLLFVAPSGTGKSTHIRLWKQVFGEDVGIINGDKPIVSVHGGAVTVHGTPWAGKENWNKNRQAPLKAICIITRSQQNWIRKVNPQEHLPLLLRQVYLPQDPDSVKLTLALFNELLEKVPVYILGCDISQAAAITACQGIIEHLS